MNCFINELYFFQIELFKYFFVIAFSNCKLFKFIFNSFEETKIIIKLDFGKNSLKFVCYLLIRNNNNIQIFN